MSEPQFIAILGSLSDGFRYYGPFESAAEAEAWSVDWIDTGWWEVVRLMPPIAT